MKTFSSTLNLCYMKKTNKKNEIQKAAVLIFGKKGYDNSSLDEIAKIAGVAKGTIFYYFNSKEELFSSLIDDGISILADQINRISKQNISVKKKLEQTIKYHFYFFKEHSNLCLMILNQLGGFKDRWQKSSNIISSKYLPVLTLLIKEGKNKKIINSKLDNESIIISLFSLLALSGVDWAIFHSDISENKIIQTTKIILFEGMLDIEK